MAAWLEDYLKRSRGSLIMVTHDRYFLDSVSNRIVEIDKGKIYSYDTNYSGFLELKAQREEMEAATEPKTPVNPAGRIRVGKTRCKSPFHQAESPSGALTRR